MDFWIAEEVKAVSPKPNTQSNENQGINFDDFQNFDNENEEKEEKSDDLLQSQELENSKNKIPAGNLFSQEELSYQNQLQNIPNLSPDLMDASRKDEKKSIGFIQQPENNKITKKEIYCVIHDEEGGDFYCKDCKSFNICIQCIVKGLHKKHAVLNIKNSSSSLKIKFDEDLRTLKQIHEEFVKKQHFFTEKIDISKQTLNNNKRLIGVYFQDIRVKIARKEKELLEKIEEMNEKNCEKFKNQQHLMMKNTEVTRNYLENYEKIRKNNEFELFKFVLEDEFSITLQELQLKDQSLFENDLKTHTMNIEEDTSNKVLTQITNFLNNINDSLEKFDFNLQEDERNIALIQANRNANTNHQKINDAVYDLHKEIWADFKTFDNIKSNLGEKTIIVPIQQDFISNNHFSSFKNESFNKNNNENNEEKTIKSQVGGKNNLNYLKKEIQSISPKKQIFSELQNPFYSSSSSKHSLIKGNSNNFWPNSKHSQTFVKKSFIENEANNMKNSFLNHRTKNFKSNLVQGRKFFAVEDMKATLFENDRSQRLKHFQNVGKSNLDRLSSSKFENRSIFSLKKFKL